MRKPLLSFFLLFVSIQMLIGQSNAKIMGVIKNSPNATLDLWFKDMKLAYKKTKLATTQIGKSGKFELDVPVNSAIDLTLKNGQEETNITLYPNQKIRLSLDYKNFDKSLKYSGDGALINNYNAAAILSTSEIPMAYFKLQENDFIDSFKVVENNAYQLLNKFADKAITQNDISVFNKKKDLLVYHFAHRKILYADARTYFAKDLDFTPISDNYFDFLTPIKIERNDLLDDYSYTDFLNSYLKLKIAQAHHQDTNQNNLDATIAVIEKDFTPAIQEYLLAKQTLNCIKFENNPDMVSKLYEVFVSHSQYNLYNAVVDSALVTFNKLKKGNEAPIIKAKDENGNSFSSDRYRGKVIYVDVWASWCGPCKREIPFAKKLYEELNGDDIVFLNVSIDADAAQWREALIKHQPNGINVIDYENGKAKISNDYAIQGIPHYIIIDSDGNIADSNAPRPSGDALKTLKAVLGR